ncbi:MAG: tRNA preQ1(34) S-adenosylmethionine ribosyltransferase-isomerase QueA [Candidatus Krumholzibacteria bacterium]|nr:tRNA preQ1(34) S-adenosylmethionine ribosyltransferase-isomerase QueA [Candidatus Krumholzibacteria bacterium]
MKLEDFNYGLPEELIAQHPLSERDDSRLLLLDRDSGTVRETVFANFARYLKEGDIVVVNETRVIPARLLGEKETGAKIEIFLTRSLGDGYWEALCRPSKRLSPGDRVLIGGSEYPVTIEKEIGGGQWRVSMPPGIPENQFIKEYGHVPLPPYIKREDAEEDQERYQTIFARKEGSVAAPTAGLHFTDRVMRNIERKGAVVIPVTLHVGPGTFRPLDNDVVEENRLPHEQIMVRTDYWDQIRGARADGREIIAVGTTVTRALEALTSGRVDDRTEVDIDGVEHILGATDLFIYPGFKFKLIDALVTNFHLPMSSLFVLVSAFAGREEMLRVYDWAVQRKYRFYSYGDAMFIR